MLTNGKEEKSRENINWKKIKTLTERKRKWNERKKYRKIINENFLN